MKNKKARKSLKKIRSILKMTYNDLPKFTQLLFEIARKTGRDFESCSKAAEEFSKQGLKLQQVL